MKSSGKRYKAYSSTFPAKIEPREIVATREKTLSKPAEVRYTQNVSVEEWDCPQPGGKKYLPRRVKENIRRNTLKIRDDLRKNSPDSISTRP
jgi:hypothetical protein